MRVVRRLMFAVMASLPLTVTTVAAQTFPDRPMRMIVPFAPGGITDLIARQLAKGLGDRLGQPVVIENKPGAGHVVSLQLASQAAPDGYTLLIGSNTGFTVTPHLYPKLASDIGALLPVSGIATAPTVLVARPDFAAQTMSELVTLARAKPDALTYGSFGVGSSAHLGMEIFRNDTGIRMTHVPYKGDAPVFTALIGKEVDVAFMTLFSAQTRLRSGELKALGVLQNNRLPGYPNLQTVADAGSKNADLPVWIALFAPPGVPAETIGKLAEATRAVVGSSEFGEFLRGRGTEPLSMDAAQLQTFIRRQSEQIAPVIRAIGLKAQ